ncbi:NXPE family member 3-like [Pseudoliparis swirei]|uniref:NXPE family member 3-like n=1 Tax=Pseudoliparis swirei TaxID=2059687 RepID=UPI0024BEC1C0|nr:NXPE family member 3-like [Pseudoliparis swirei]
MSILDVFLSRIQDLSLSLSLSQFQTKARPPPLPPRVSSPHHTARSFCSFQPLTPQDALEEHLLLASSSWPETPPLPALISWQQTSDAAHSSFTILPGRREGRWRVGDQLEVLIQTSDFQGRPRKSGGDFLLARLHNRTLQAGVAGQVVDHLNGSYSAVFSLLWEGDAQVEVTLVHPSEAISVLKRLSREEPDRIYFRSLFRSGALSETTVCNVCLRPTGPMCNHTDLRTGEPWFCYKPKNLSCDARINHQTGGRDTRLKAQEVKLFQRGLNLKVFIRTSGPSNVTVLPQKEGQLMVKSSTMTSGPSGYYYGGLWRALSGPPVRQFNQSSIAACLKGKAVHIYGDSTIRQWFHFLKAALPDLKEFDLHSQKQSGPFMLLDYGHNILVKYRFHSPPISIGSILTSQLHYIANELDDLIGGPETVVAFCIWAHFPSFPMEIYIRRLQSIRRAVVRLLNRAPDTLVIIRTGNPKDLTLSVSISNSDWYSLQCDKVLRAVFRGLNVHLIDAWEMTLAHHLPHDLHPPPPIIENMVNQLLSHVCPQKDG